jgi:hypothetical protein
MMTSPRRPLPRLRSVAIALAALALVAVGTRSAHAGDGAQFSGDCGSTFVNKKVGANEQWAITWQLFGSASGNVLKLDGSAPSFIECDWQDDDGTNEIFNCYGSSACSGPQCGGTQWTLIASNLSIARTFFLPPGVDTSDPVSDCDPR